MKTKGKCLIFNLKSKFSCTVISEDSYYKSVGEEGKNFLDTVRVVDFEIIWYLKVSFFQKEIVEISSNEFFGI